MSSSSSSTPISARGRTSSPSFCPRWTHRTWDRPVAAVLPRRPAPELAGARRRRLQEFFYRLVQVSRDWAHLFAITDILRGRKEGWRPTGSSAATKSELGRRFYAGPVFWGGGTAALWVGLSLYHMTAANWLDFAPMLYSGAVYCAIVLQSLRITANAERHFVPSLEMAFTPPPRSCRRYAFAVK